MRAGRHSRGPTRRPYSVLLADPRTFNCAFDVLTLAGGEEYWWPYAVAVSAQTAIVHLAGMRVPPPQPPWRLGHNPHVWIVDRGEVPPAPAGSAHSYRAKPTVLGYYRNCLVFVDAARSQGSIMVAGDQEPAGRLRDLLADQAVLAQNPPDEQSGSAHWTFEAADGIITLIDIALAWVFPVEDALRAAALVRHAEESRTAETMPQSEPADAATAVMEPARPAVLARPTVPAMPVVPATPVEPVAVTEPAVDPRMEEWLRLVKEAATTQPATTIPVTQRPTVPGPWDAAFTFREPEETVIAHSTQPLPTTDPPAEPVVEQLTEPVLVEQVPEPVTEPVDDESWADFAVSSVNKRGTQ